MGSPPHSVTPGWAGPASAAPWWSGLDGAYGAPWAVSEHPAAHTLQHYTSDADGLCTRLIKPKVMEGTVAAQDEFYRSEYTPLQTSCPPTSSHAGFLALPLSRNLQRTPCA